MSYSNHERGFALASRRSPKLSRLYVQCAADEDLAAWPDRRIWDELHTRLYDKDGGELHEGPIVQKGVTPVRSYVSAPMRHGRMFLAGDAVHIVPPTGAKGLNLAVADVRVLSRALIEFFRTGATERLDRYSDTCLKRVWKVTRYSNYMTSLLHRFETHSTFERRVQQAELEYVAGSLAARTTIARKLRRAAVRGGLTPPLALRILPTALPAGSSRMLRRSGVLAAALGCLVLGPIATQGAGLSIAADPSADPYAARQPSRCAGPTRRSGV